MYYTLRHPLVIEKFTKVINAMCQAVPSSKVVTACKQLNFYCRLHDNRKAIIVFFKVARACYHVIRGHRKRNVAIRKDMN